MQKSFTTVDIRAAREIYAKHTKAIAAAKSGDETVFVLLLMKLVEELSDIGKAVDYNSSRGDADECC